MCAITIRIGVKKTQVIPIGQDRIKGGLFNDLCNSDLCIEDQSGQNNPHKGHAPRKLPLD